MSSLSIEQIQMLTSDLGAQALAAAGEVAEQEMHPAIIERLREKFPAELVAAAMILAGLRVRARERFALADSMFFDSSDLLEQASSEPVARHKARRFADVGSVADLCCGAGGDAVEIARCADCAVAVDRRLESLLCARANATAAGLTDRVWPVAGDVERWYPHADAYHIDPPRRQEGRRLRAEESDPWVAIVESITHDRGNVAGKLSPAIDLASLSWADEVEFISENGTLKQAVTWSGDLARHRRSATVIRSRQGHTQDSETIFSDSPRSVPELTATLSVGQILVEPDAAVIRAGLLGNLAQRHEAGLIDPHLPLLSARRALSDTLLARNYEVLDVIPWSIKRVRQLLRERSWRVTEVKTRAFACQPAEILAGLKGLDLSADAPAMVLWAVRLGAKPVCILTRRIAREAKSRKGLSASDL